MKKLLALLLCFSMLLVLAACGGDEEKTKETEAQTEEITEDELAKDEEVTEDEEIAEDEEYYEEEEEIVSDPVPAELLGEWKGVIDLNAMMGSALDGAELDLSFMDDYKDIALEMNLEFFEDNTAKLWYTEETVDPFVDAMITFTIELMTNPEYLAIVAEVSVEEAIEYIESNGMSVEEYKEYILSMYTAESFKESLGMNITDYEFYVLDTEVCVYDSESYMEFPLVFENNELKMLEESAMFQIDFVKQ